MRNKKTLLTKVYQLNFDFDFVPQIAQQYTFLKNHTSPGDMSASTWKWSKNKRSYFKDSAGTPLDQKTTNDAEDMLCEWGVQGAHSPNHRRLQVVQCEVLRTSSSTRGPLLCAPCSPSVHLPTFLAFYCPLDGVLILDTFSPRILTFGHQYA